MFVFDFFRSNIKRVDEMREHIEDVLADGLERIRGSKTVDKGEIAIAEAVMFGIETYSKITIPAKVKKEVDKSVVKTLDTMNFMVVHQLRKK